MFDDRLDAARQLVQALRREVREPPVVLGIPRGAVPMAAHIAQALEGELDVVLVHKLGAPGNPEFAIGAVSEDGTIEVSDAVRRRFGTEYIDAEAARERETLRSRRQRYTPLRPPVSVRDREVIVVDDGSATGATMRAALHAMRARRPKRLIAALAVAPPEVAREFEAEADAVVCLQTPEPFMAVGFFFRDFQQVSDAEVESLLTVSDSP